MRFVATLLKIYEQYHGGVENKHLSGKIINS